MVSKYYAGVVAGMSERKRFPWLKFIGAAFVAGAELEMKHETVEEYVWENVHCMHDSELPGTYEGVLEDMRCFKEGV
jgi:hypothetical protein